MQPVPNFMQQTVPAFSWKKLATIGANYLAYLLSGLTLGILLDLLLFIAVLFHYSRSPTHSILTNSGLKSVLTCTGFALPISSCYGLCIQAKRWPLHAICSCFCIVLSSIALTLLAGGLWLTHLFFYGLLS